MLLATAAVCLAACGQTPSAPSASAASLSSATSAANDEGGTKQTWQNFAARGWNCRTPNNGPVTVCSPPNQPLPTVAIPPAQPPANRPATVNLKRWRNGVFEANVLLMRPEIYNGQSCESTGLPYTFVGVLGYFECAHMVG
jgi:hypothetical protein